MANAEQAVRDAAERLHAAIQDAKASGLAVVWPHRPGDLLSISISETGKFGQPLDLSDKERAVIPALDPSASNDPSGFISSEGRPPRPRR
ncbi:hypothetical protein JNB71_03490 [Rhizobium herbae]|uniref:Uncharacterized protein n=1 Tax=Rhizobium herbae TaxID=508661 RepID=A0ABS7H6D2_9HYPH|nr:hypothetical protein [Rhizobium herbae]MBW9062375.1 hypothetical protein [Rhizobium herbae]